VSAEPVPATNSPSSDRVSVEIADHVATVTLTRPDKHNALDLAMFEAIIGAAARVAEERGVRAAVLAGEGPSFCSGLDVMSIMSAEQGLEGLTNPLHGGNPNWFQRAAYDWVRLPVPVIAAVHGNCFGGGLQIALAADVRIARPDARLSVMEVKWGLIPDMSITRTLPRLVGIDVAKELTYTARVFSGEEASRLGVVTRLSEDPLADARALAAEIASKSPDAVRAAKRLYDEGWTASAAESLALEAELQLSLIGSRNQLEAVRAGLAREAAEFEDPAPGARPNQRAAH
jgi:enoyl-CoA hydratase/carnithine racemase